jgi:hypothetical protein
VDALELVCTSASCDPMLDAVTGLSTYLTGCVNLLENNGFTVPTTLDVTDLD